MVNQSYYREPDTSSCNVEVLDRYICVNCTGVCNIPGTFATRGKRVDYYLLYMWKGKIDIVAGGRANKISEGQMIIFRPDEEYRYQKLNTEDMQYFWAHFSGFGVRDLLDSFGFLTGEIINPGINGHVSHEFTNMFQNFIMKDRFFETAASANMLNILTALGRSVHEIADENSPAGQNRISHSIHYIHENYNREIRIEGLADMEHMSISSYRKIFKHYTGLSPRTYILDLRIKNARSLMSYTDLSIKEIAAMVGYEDQLYFSRLFKLYAGVSPSTYRSIMS